MITGNNGILQKAGQAKNITEKAHVIEIAKLAYNSKLIEGLGEKPSQATVLSAIIGELENHGYEVVTVSNAGSTYSGVELLEGETTVTI